MIMRGMTERLLWAAALLVAVVFAVSPYVLAPVPYKNVRLIESYRTDGYRYFTVNFEKTDCDIVEFVVIGTSLGVKTNLTRQWQALDGYADGKTPPQDRSVGDQQLRGRLNVEGQYFNEYQIRTRHDCDGIDVDKIFLTYDASRTGG